MMIDQLNPVLGQ